MQTIHKTSDVFGISRDLPLTYTERASVDNALRENLSRDKHVIIYGSSKQGKTCLRRHCIRPEDAILVQCQSNWTIAKLSEAILKSAGFRVEVSATRTAEGKSKLVAKAQGGIDIPLFGKFGAETGGEEEDTRTSAVTVEPLELDPSDPNDLVRALASIKFSKFIILEDFHYLPQETQSEFAFVLKAIHEISDLIFIIVAVWREENRLIVFNGDLAGRIASVDADKWTEEELRDLIAVGEVLLNVSFAEQFKRELIKESLHSVYIVQDACYKLCTSAKIEQTQAECVVLGDGVNAVDLVRQVIEESSARYTAFITNFAGGFTETDLEMYKWILYPVLTSRIEDLTSGVHYRRVREKIISEHPRGKGLNPGNVTQALVSIPALQSKKNIKPFVLDYDQSNLKLSVVDKSFLIWLSVQDRDALLEMIDLPSAGSANGA